MDIGPTELIIVLVIVILVFGVGRIGQLGSELGRAIREFRTGLQNDPPAAPAEKREARPASDQ